MRALVLLAGLLAGCSPLTEGEAQVTVAEAQLAAEAEALVAGSVALATSFTLGGDTSAGAADLAMRVEAALPCAGVSVDGATLYVEYGARPGACAFGGQTYAGSQAITLVATAPDAAVVELAFDGFHDEAVSVDGSATVTYASASAARRVVGTLTYTRLADGRTATGSGDRTHAQFEDLDGFEATGTRTFDTERGAWTLTFDGARMRFVDPVPEAGRYVLDTPFGERVELEFHRAESAKIEVVAESGSRTYDFEVTTTERP
jgi:hypothetical protein